jgi:two-component system chemotaxis response regulator CheY
MFLRKHCKWAEMIDLTTLTILIVDDQEFVRTIVKSMLGQLGITNTLEAADGTEALTVVADHKPDAVICDIQMRPTDGFGFVKQLRQTKGISDIPVIMLTAHTDSATTDKAHGLNIDAFISKPVLPTTLCQTITRVITRRVVIG